MCTTNVYRIHFQFFKLKKSYKIVSPKLLQTLYRELTNYREFSNSPYEGVTLITTAILQ